MDWWEEYFDELYLEMYAFVDREDASRKQVEFIERALKLERGMRVLDLACGQGRHAIPLARRGYRVIGLDYSPVLLSEAVRRDSDGRVLFVRGDMRSIPFRDGSMDAVYSFFTSFGYFSHRDNVKVLGEVARVLKRGGRFLLDLSNPVRIVRNPVGESVMQFGDRRLVERYRLNGGEMVVHSTLQFFRRLPDGRWEMVAQREHRVMLYTPSRLKHIFDGLGMEVEALYGDWRDASSYSEDSRRLILVARRR